MDRQQQNCRHCSQFSVFPSFPDLTNLNEPITVKTAPRRPFEQPAGLASVLDITPTATSYYATRYSPNCFSLAAHHALRGAVIGSVFGGALALSTAVSSGYRGSSAASYAGQGALRNAAGFASWTSLYAFSRCSLARFRGRQDMLNAVVAGGFTGGVLTIATNPRVWRYNQSVLLTNVAGSAMVALAFDALNRM